MDLMRYLIHLVGDVHQPLHVGNGYDRGANWCNVKYKIGEGEKASYKSTNLHSFWDSVMVEELFYIEKELNPNFKMPGWKGYKELADLITKDRAELNTEDIKSASPLQWYREAQALHSQVYIDKEPGTHPSQREYCMRLIKDENGKAVQDERGMSKTVKASGAAEATRPYMHASAKLIKSQIMKAGLRLAHTINEMAQKQYLDGKEDYQSKKVSELKEMLVEFENGK
jgi:hypothetical protein